MSRIRNKEYNTVHHLTSRIAHQAFFLEDEEKDDFLSLVKRVSAFSGVELIGWCVMDNHFHLYTYLPHPPTLTDEEVLARFRLLKGDASRLFSDEDDDRIVPTHLCEVGVACQTPRANVGEDAECWRGVSDTLRKCPDDGRAAARAKLLESIRRRMYSIAEYMRMIKKWFSDRYNERSGHKGTMWDAPYGDHPFFLPESPENYSDLRDVLAYIHLNPIRANIANRYDEYAWSSYTAFKKGDAEAVAAMRRVYPKMSDDEISEAHELRMGRLLEVWKRKRAEEIARKRLAGYEVPADALTAECQIAQARERIERIQQEIVQLQLARKIATGEPARRELICRQIVKLSALYPDSTPQSISAAIEVPLRTVQRYVGKLLKTGQLSKGEGGIISAA